MVGDKIGTNKDFVVNEVDGKYTTTFDFKGTYTLWEFNADGEELSFDYAIERQFHRRI